MYGYDEQRVATREGMNARISEMQAAMLRVKLKKLGECVARRRRFAEIYDAGIRNETIALPTRREGVEEAYHQYVVRCSNRDGITESLRKADIGYGIHYAVPVHQMSPYRALRQVPAGLPVTERASAEILSLPIHEALSEKDVERVAEVLNTADGAVRSD